MRLINSKIFHLMNFQISVFGYRQSNDISCYFDLFFFPESAKKVKFDVIIISSSDFKLKT